MTYIVTLFARADTRPRSYFLAVQTLARGFQQCKLVEARFALLGFNLISDAVPLEGGFHSELAKYSSNPLYVYGYL